MKRINWNVSVLMMFVLALFMFTPAFAGDATVATGGKGGFYHNGLFNYFSAAVKRVSDGDLELERSHDKGTDGTIHNVKLVAKGSDNDGADLAFIQLGGYVLNPDDNIEVLGTVMWELGHLVAPKGSPVDEFSDLETKGKSVGLNTRGGSMVTFKVFQKEDKDYERTVPTDITKPFKAIKKMQAGELDSYFFVSAPQTKDIKRFNDNKMIYLDFDDGDFYDFEYGPNKKQLYYKVKVGKKQGYPNKFVTVAVPCVVIANKKWLEENEEMEEVLFDAIGMTYNSVKASNPKRFNYWPDTK